MNDRPLGFCHPCGTFDGYFSSARICGQQTAGAVAMAIRIFRTQRNSRESWLAVNDAGTVTFHVENFGTRQRRDGLDERVRTMSASEAKARWPCYSQSIDLAVAEVAKRRYTPLDPIASTATHDGAKVRPSSRDHWWARPTSVQGPRP